MIRQNVRVSASLVSNRAKASALVQTASRYSSMITLCHGQKVANAKSMLGLLSLLSGDANEMTLAVEGADECEAASAVIQLMES